MGWSVGYDSNWKRDIGYGVPARCDYPGCKARIDRGLAYVCGGEPYGGEHGCGLYFCSKHRGWACEEEPCPHSGHQPSPDVPKWMRHKLKHPSWRDWRDENPGEVERMRNALNMHHKPRKNNGNAMESGPS